MISSTAAGPVAETTRSRVLVGHTGRVHSVAFSPDGKWLASCGDGIRLWDLSKPADKP